VIWRSIDFVWGESAFLLLFVPILLCAYALLERYRRRCLESFGDEHVLSIIVVQRSKWLFWIKVGLLAAALTFGIGAMMRPRGNPQAPIPLTAEEEKQLASGQMRRRHDILFLVDVSASMGVADNGVARTQRLGIAKELVDSVVSQLRGENVALTAFTTQVLSIVPLTTDYLFTRLMLHNLNINEGNTEGTDLIQALSSASSTFNKTPNSVAKTLVLVSDGDNHFVNGSGRSKQLEAVRAVAAHLKEQGIHVIALGVGSEKGGKVPDIKYHGEPVESAQVPEALERIASPDSYYNADLHSILWVAQRVKQEIEARTTLQAPEGNLAAREAQGAFVYDDYFQYPLAVALLALALFLCLPDTLMQRAENGLGNLVVRILPLLLFMLSASSLFAQNLDQQAREAEVFVEAEEFERALGLYESLVGGVPPGWQQAALEYNRATTFLLSGKVNEALEVYQELSVSPPFPELAMRIAFNRALGLYMRASLFDRLFQDDSETINVLKTSVWEQVFSAIGVALKAECERNIALGGKECDMEPAMAFLSDLAEEGSAKAALGEEPMTEESAVQLLGAIQKEAHALQLDVNSVTTKQVLVNLIRSEQQLLKVGRFLLSDPKKATTEFVSQVKQSQESVWKAAPVLLGAMRRDQMEQWQRHVLSSTEAAWKEVFRLFNEGYLSAQEAQAAWDSAEEKKWVQAVRWSNLAQESWFSALILLKRMKEIEKPAEMKESHISTTKLMEQLQSMEQDDKSAPHLLEGVNVKKVDQPW